MARKYKYRYQASIDRETLPHIQALSRDLGFLVETPGTYYGEPSPPALLDSLAAVYRTDPAAVTAALRGLGVVGEAEPQAA